MYPSSCNANRIEKMNKEKVMTKRLNYSKILFIAKPISGISYAGLHD